jgi:hypothetical protein
MVNTALMFSSARDTWATPAALLADVDAFYGGACGVAWYDPCPLAPSYDSLQDPWPSSPASPASPASRHIYMNPPYGREIGRWIARALGESARRGADLVMLLPARTDTAWFQPLFSRAHALCFIRGRLKFGGQASSAPFPSVLVYVAASSAGDAGPDARRFCAHFARYGYTVLRQPNERHELT